ncbi:MAG: SDR family NAD(P)-dependent oxidoreductase [Bacteroidota bacterium]
MKTILVTGGNRGIGLEICRQLDALGHQVIMGSRDLAKGLKAAENLSDRVIVGQLDVTDEESIRNLFNTVKTGTGKMDVLINNAGMGAGSDKDESTLFCLVKNLAKRDFPQVWQFARTIKPYIPGSKQQGAKNASLSRVKQVMETNFYGPWRMIQVFYPLLLRSGEGRIINISSGMGELKSLTGIYPGYSLSKSSLNALTIMFSNEFGEKIKVNAMCPGWVRTDMGGADAPRHVSEGADTAVWLSTAQEIPTGRFFRDRQEIDW